MESPSHPARIGNLVRFDIDLLLGLSENPAYISYPRQRIRSHRRYAPFGEQIAGTGSSPNTLRFNGRERDSDTGLYYFRARYYDPDIGRFLSEDPLGFTAGDHTLYGYVSNNPLVANDPDGEIANFIIGAPIGGGGELLSQYLESKITGEPFEPDIFRVSVAAGAGAAGVGVAKAVGTVFSTASRLHQAGRVGASSVSEVGIGYLADRLNGDQTTVNGSLARAGFGAVGGIAGEIVSTRYLSRPNPSSDLARADVLDKIGQNRIDQGLPRPGRAQARFNQADALRQSVADGAVSDFLGSSSTPTPTPTASYPSTSIGSGTSNLAFTSGGKP